MIGVHVSPSFGVTELGGNQSYDQYIIQKKRDSLQTQRFYSNKRVSIEMLTRIFVLRT